MNKLEMLIEQKSKLLKLNKEIKEKEFQNVNLKNKLEADINDIRNNTDFPKILNKTKPTIADIDSYINNNESIKKQTEKINRCRPLIDSKKRIFNIEFKFFELLDGIEEL